MQATGSDVEQKGRTDDHLLLDCPDEVQLWAALLRAGLRRGGKGARKPEIGPLDKNRVGVLSSKMAHQPADDKA